MQDRVASKRLGMMKKAGALALLSFVMWSAVTNWREFRSSFLVNRALVKRSYLHANWAIALNPANPNVYKTRARLLMTDDRPAEAAKDLETALNLRPHDYLLWLRLGYAHYKTNNFVGARRAYHQAMRLAPFYARPQWYLGRLLLKRESPEESFRHLRQAVAYDQKLLPQVMHLARKRFGSDPVAIERAIEPGTPESKLGLARYFIKHGLETEGMKSFIMGDEVNDQDREALVSQLIAAKKFSLAFEVWAKKLTAPVGDEFNARPFGLLNGDFEDEVDFANRGFGWRLGREEAGVKFKLDGQQPSSGTSSLLINFRGKSDPGTLLASQLVLVEPNQRYRLNFAARSQELVTGGVPRVTVTDLNTGQLLAQLPIPPGTSDGWRDYMAEITTTEMTHAVNVGIHRLSCPATPCPIFGQLWLDNFVLEKVVK